MPVESSVSSNPSHTGSLASELPDQPGRMAPAVFDSIRRELFWLTPLGLATVSLTVYLLAHQKWGASVAGTLTLPVEVAGIATTILIARGAPARLPALRIPG